MNILVNVNTTQGNFIYEIRMTNQKRTSTPKKWKCDFQRNKTFIHITYIS